jgi:excinuclease ABC subunit A
MGPDGGENGGNIVFNGTPEELAKYSESVTGNFLHSKIFST